jgi:hypothetical protein
VHCDVAFTPIVDGLQMTPTEVIAGGGVDCTVTDAVPDFVVSCVLVAFTVTVPATAGAVKAPFALIPPAPADQVTAELKLPVPCTVAVHCDVACAAIAAGTQVTATEVMEGDIEAGGFELAPPPPPQAVIEKRIAHSTKAYSSQVCVIFFLKWWREKLLIRAFLAKTLVRNTFTAKEATAEHIGSVRRGCWQPEARSQPK